MIMKKILTYSFLISIFLGLSDSILAQDPNFSMFYNNPTYYNPGMVAIGNGLTLRANTRSLWTPIPSKFNTSSVSVEAEAINKVGVGFQAYTDVAGEGFLRTSGANFQYMYRPIESKNFLLQIGFSAGLVNKYIDWNKLVFSDQLDEVHGVVQPSAFQNPQTRTVTYGDFASGFAIKFNAPHKKSRQVFRKVMGTLGGGFHHLTSPKDAFLGDNERLPIKFVGHTNWNILINKVIYAPAAIYERQNKFETFTIGMNVINKPFFAGFWIRNQNYLFSGDNFDSFIATIGVQLNPKNTATYRIAYSFDMTLSRLKTNSIGSHEVSLVIDLDNRVLFQRIKNTKKMREKYKCPEDFKGFD
jgi:type IX secretion system PorP/SprF family membrane protein